METETQAVNSKRWLVGGADLDRPIWEDASLRGFVMAY